MSDVKAPIREGTQSKVGRSYLAGLKVVDTDTHITEWHDLWTSRASPKYKSLVPRMETKDGAIKWVMGDGHIISNDSGFGAIKRDGSKTFGAAFMDLSVNEVHPGAYDVKERVAYMDRNGIAAQIGYTNLLGFAGNRAMVVDADLRLVSTQILNDALAEFQAESNNRIYPMAMLPWWDIKACIAEAERCANMGMRGVNMNQAPDANGLPDLGDQYWDPLWEFCQDRKLPVNFHIGASDQTASWFGKGFFKGFSRDQMMAFGGCLLFASNMTIMINMLISDIFDRHPKLKIVSVESGVGWIPYMLELLDYQVTESYGANPSESILDRFRRHFYICSWYENENVLNALRMVGADNILFETDFPHPTCLYPDPLEYVAPLLAQMNPEQRRKMFQTNAEHLYNLDLSAASAL